MPYYNVTRCEVEKCAKLVYQTYARRMVQDNATIIYSIYMKELECLFWILDSSVRTVMHLI